MKTNVKANIALLTILLFTSFSTFSQARKKADEDTENWRYELEGVKQGEQGTYLIKVWQYSKKPNVAIEQAKKNAVHGVVFKGYSGPGAQKPLTSNPNLEQEKADFFKDFFADNGKYMKYVNVTGDGAVAAEDRLKVGKEYKIGVVVSVSSAQLRKDLEAAGIIKGLSSGF
jgi:hypothetical protein